MYVPQTRNVGKIHDSNARTNANVNTLHVQ